MEKICEFCTSLRSTVYCKADAAYLCLSCDAKVHSANALSSRHVRTFLCDSCRYSPAYARCLVHEMFLCRGCDQSLHRISSQHQKRVVSSYLGCPSARDFASLWGFKLDELDRSDVQDQLFSASCAALQPNAANLNIPGDSCPSSSTLISSTESDVRSSSQQTEMPCKGQKQQDTLFILQQIVDLKKLQLTEKKGKCAIRGEEQKDISSSLRTTSNKVDSNLDHLQHSQDHDTDLHERNCPLPELNLDSLALRFSSLENLSLSSTVANPLLGESFWQCKSPVQSSQLWSQNMQNLGVCEDIVYHDDFNIPDVDTTFRNFEELFVADQDPIRASLDDVDVSSSLEKNVSLDNSDNINTKAREAASVALSIYSGHSANISDNKGLSCQVLNFPGCVDSRQIILPSYSAMSFSISRLSAESSGTEYHDSGLSPDVTGDEASCHSPDLDGTRSQARENAVMRYKEKKKARMNENQVRYAPRKARSDGKKQVRGRSRRIDGYNSDSVDVARS